MVKSNHVVDIVESGVTVEIKNVDASVDGGVISWLLPVTVSEASDSDTDVTMLELETSTKVLVPGAYCATEVVKKSVELASSAAGSELVSRALGLTLLEIKGSKNVLVSLLELVKEGVGSAFTVIELEPSS